ncbi:MAG: DNA-binding protein [Clostridia bacterium]|nr:DNA-binding protein [Clostridia bacterium]
MTKNLHISALLDVYGAFLGDKARTLTEYYYNEDLSLSEIAENEGITRQGVRDQIKRAEAQLLSLEEKCGYCEKFSRLKELSASCKGDDKALSEMLDIINNL